MRHLLVTTLMLVISFSAMAGTSHQKRVAVAKVYKALRKKGAAAVCEVQAPLARCVYTTAETCQEAVSQNLETCITQDQKMRANFMLTSEQEKTLGSAMLVCAQTLAMKAKPVNYQCLSESGQVKSFNAKFLAALGADTQALAQKKTEFAQAPVFVKFSMLEKMDINKFALAQAKPKSLAEQMSRKMFLRMENDSIAQFVAQAAEQIETALDRSERSPASDSSFHPAVTEKLRKRLDKIRSRSYLIK